MALKTISLSETGTAAFTAANSVDEIATSANDGT